MVGRHKLALNGLQLCFFSPFTFSVSLSLSIYGSCYTANCPTSKQKKQESMDDCQSNDVFQLTLRWTNHNKKRSDDKKKGERVPGFTDCMCNSGPTSCETEGCQPRSAVGLIVGVPFPLLSICFCTTSIFLSSHAETHPFRKKREPKRINPVITHYA